MTQKQKRTARSDRGGEVELRRRRERAGARSELAVAALLMAKGYRILARRWLCPHGEIDLIAVRGNRLAFVEVKRRLSEQAAQASISEAQSYRIRSAADVWLARNPRYQAYEIHFDAAFALPWRLPKHVQDAV